MLDSITIPDSVTSIGSFAFSNTALESITLPFVGSTKDGRENTHFGYIFGASSYSYNDNYVPKSLKKVVITGGTNIGNLAFYKCTSLESVTIPHSVTSIDESAFNSCASLQSVTFGENSQLASIGGGAFSNCISLTSITIPDTVTSIGSYAFSGCKANIIWGERPTITAIGKYAFGGYAGTSITIPDTVTGIGSYAFSGCKANIIWGERPTITTIDNVHTFKEYEGVSITIPASITNIWGAVFNVCASLTEFNVDENNPTYCSENGILFSKDKRTLVAYPAGRKNSSFIIPNNVTSIGDYACSNCISLTSITIPDGVKSIGDYAFRGCTSLMSITIPDSVTSIESWAFYGCSLLESVYFGGTAEEWSAISIGSNNTPLTSATVYYYSDELTEEQKADGNNYWYYVDGVPTVWTKETI